MQGGNMDAFKEERIAELVETWDECFCDLPDPRMDRTKLHSLHDILFLSLCGILAGAETWTDIELFGKSRKEWLQKYIELPNGIPSHDTIGRVFSLLDAKSFQERFFEWTKTLKNKNDKLIAIDGKTARRSGGVDSSPIHLVSAWSVANHLVLSQVAVTEKSNEITAIPELLENLNIKECIITIDAMGCQKKIAEKILQSGGDYIFALKGNQSNLHDDVKLFFDGLFSGKYPDKYCDYHETWNKGHGRIENRRAWVLKDMGNLNTNGWTGIKSIILIESDRTINGVTTIERRFYVSSKIGMASEFCRWIRAHWGIENSLHWVLDVAFNEDQCRVRSGYAAINFGLLRKMALNLLKNNKARKGGVKSKRLQAGWDKDFLEDILKGI